MFKPYSSFIAATDEDISKFPELNLFWHMDDFKPSGGNVSTWTDRVRGVKLTFTADVPGSIVRKDSEGIYADDTQTIVVTGPMPIITAAHYVALVSIGKTTSGSTVNGLNFTLGTSQESKLSMSTTGAVIYNAAALNTAPTLSPAALTTANKPACCIAYADFVDTTSPRIERIISNNDFSAAASSAFGAGTTTSLGVITPGQFANAFALAALGAGSGDRQVSIAVFAFTNPKTAIELKIAANEMARTRRLFAGFRR